MTASVVRWSGIVLILGVVLFAVGRMLVPNTPMETQAPYLANLLLFLAGLFILLALPALYSRQAQAAGALGLVGHVLLSIGLMMVVLYAGAPLLYPTLTDPAGESPFALTLGIALLLGIGLTAIATTRAGVYPRWAGVALLVAAGGFFFEFFITEFLPPVASTIGGAFFGILFALALGSIGWSAWRAPVVDAPFSGAPASH